MVKLLISDFPIKDVEFWQNMRYKMTTLTKSGSIKVSLVVTSFLLASAFVPVEATKLTAQPLPHEKDLADASQVQAIAPPNSRFHKSNDFRDLDKASQEQAAKAAKQAELEQQKSAVAQIKAAEAQMKSSIDANNRAVQLGKQGLFVEAISEHEKAVALDPSNKQFRINLSAARTAYGQQRLSQGDYASASHLFRQALASASDNGLAGRLLVTSITKMGLNPSSADVRINLGDQLIKAGDLEGAAIEYQAAIELSDSSRAYVKMGDLALRYGQSANASDWYRQSLAKDPDCASAYRQLGFIALSQKDLTQAAAYLRKAVILDGKDTLAGDALVDLWRKQVAANSMVADNHLGLAAALQITGDLNGALDEYQKVQSIDPKNPHLAVGRASLNSAYQHIQAEKHRLAAQTFYGQNLRKEALSEISQAVMLEPRNAKYQQLLGECLEANGDYQGAHQAYLTCVLIDPENNKEAAARMKQMQTGLSVGSSSNQIQDAGTATSQGAVNRLPQTSQENQEQPPMNKNTDALTHDNQLSNVSVSNIQSAAKDTFEGRAASENISTSSDQVDKSAGKTSASSSVEDLISKVSKSESDHDYSTAAFILRQILANNLQNADLHHRLAVDLMNSGDIVEAISEFRIASALTPKTKAYADDLAQALTIHKRAEADNANSQKKACAIGEEK